MENPTKTLPEAPQVQKGVRLTASKPETPVLPVELHLEMTSQGGFEVVTASSGGDDNSWKFEGRRRRVVESIPRRLFRGLARLMRFENNAHNKIMRRGAALIVVGTAAVWLASALGISATVPFTFVIGVSVLTALAVYNLGRRIHRALTRHGNRVEGNVNRELDDINRDQENDN